MDDALAKLLGALIGSGAQRSSELNGVIDRNLTHGLGVISNSLIHEKGSVTNDAETMAALSTAARIPRSGALPTGTQ